MERKNNLEIMVIPSEEARKMFGVSKRTWAIWREKKLLRYVKIGQLIFYKVDDIKEFIDNHVVENNNDNKQHHEEDANVENYIAHIAPDVESYIAHIAPDVESYIAHIAPDVELKVCKNGNIYKDGVLIKPEKLANRLFFRYNGKSGERRRILVARLVADYFVPNPSLRKFIGYKDGNTLNVNAENLFWK